MFTRSKYYALIISSCLYGCNLLAQQAGVTIIGNLGNGPEQNTNIHDFINTDNNPYQNNTVNAPPTQQQMAELNVNESKDTQQSIEPSLDNEFHMRFQVESGGPNNSYSSSGYMSSSGGSGSGKVKKH